MTDSLQLGFQSLEESAARDAHQALIAKLVPIAQGLARVRPAGLTVADVRIEAVRHGILPATAKGRELAFLGVVMRKAGLISTGEHRRSDVDASHGNLHVVYRRP